jgi:ABC-type Na+ efflux pump permease subunit
MGKLMPLVEKEVKDLLRDPRIYVGLIIPILMLPLMSFAMSTAMGSATETAAQNLKITFIDYDATENSNGFLSLLTHMGLNTSSVSVDTLDKALEETKNLGFKALLIIPKGFEKDLLSHGRAKVEVYTIIESIGVGSIGAYSAIDATLETSSEMLSNILISKLAPTIDPETLRDPLNITRYSTIKDRIIQIPPQALIGQLMMGYSIMIPMVLLILAITVTQISSTATAIENEEKTLETLLTFPVTRYDILMAKLLGSFVVAVLGGILFTVGFLVYFGGMSNLISPSIAAGSTLQALPLPTPEAYIVLVLSLILSILFITSLGIVIGALSNDVRMSNSLLGIVIIPVLIPSLLIMYGDVKSLPLVLQLLVYSMPTSYPMIVAKEMITSTIPVEVFYGIPYSAALTMIVLYATSKLLAPEKLLTLQHRLRRTKKGQTSDLE